jgi:hypothetical protein
MVQQVRPELPTEGTELLELDQAAQLFTAGMAAMAILARATAETAAPRHPPATELEQLGDTAALVSTVALAVVARLQALVLKLLSGAQVDRRLNLFPRGRGEREATATRRSHFPAVAC